MTCHALVIQTKIGTDEIVPFDSDSDTVGEVFALHECTCTHIRTTLTEAAEANFVWGGSVAAECCKWRGVRDPSP